MDFIIYFCVIVLYFLPGFIAYKKQLKHWKWWLFFNITIGWIFLPWIAMLIVVMSEGND